MAQCQLEQALWVPHHLRGGSKSQRIGSRFKVGQMMTAKSHRLIRTRDTETIPSDYGFARLMMLEARHERARA